MEDYTDEITCSILLPVMSEWQCRVFGGKSYSSLIFRPANGFEPNWFWRKMQYICFGHIWEKV